MMALFCSDSTYPAIGTFQVAGTFVVCGKGETGFGAASGILATEETDVCD